MSSEPHSPFLAALAAGCAADPLAEKWLVAPSRRVGYQWLDALTRAGHALLNVRVTTLPHLALELAGPALQRRGLTLLRSREAQLLVEQLWLQLRGAGAGYLFALQPSAGLAQALHRSVQDLRLAGLTPRALKARAFEVRDKRDELSRLLAAYEQALADRRLADRAEVLRLATRRLREDSDALPADARVLAADQGNGIGTGLEAALFEAIPAGQRVLLPLDRGATRSEQNTALSAAVGEVNEVREVLRRCLARGIPLDEVELLHTDAETYVPLIFELASALLPDAAGVPPVTFAEGLPVRMFRPGRALAAWVSWVSQDFPQATIVRALQDGLLAVRSEQHSFARLAALLRNVAIGAGRERYEPALAKEIKAAVDGLARLAAAGDDEHAGKARRALEQRRAGLLRLRAALRKILALTPAAEAPAADVLRAAATFLAEHVRCASQLDEYGRHMLLREIEGLARSLAQQQEDSTGAGPDGLDAWQWLADLPREVRVGGMGPRPGCLHVSSLRLGGHSGRRHTFVLGLDDSRFPGAGLQDPVLLDRERRGLSRALPTAAARLDERRGELEALLGRLPGAVTLSYPCRDVAGDRGLFPASAVLATYRVITGDAEGDHQALQRYLPPPAAFAPHAEDRALDAREWWLWRLLQQGGVINAAELLGQTVPTAGRGMLARRERASGRFTIYDGHVPAAGAELDPAAADGPVLSASRLEKLARCPLEYFLIYVLRVEPPPELDADPDVWLDALSRGSLLHAVFCTFIRELQEAGRVPELARDAGRLQQLIAAEAAAWRGTLPPPSEAVYLRELEQLSRIGRIFLEQEEVHFAQHEIVCAEAAVGMAPDGAGTSLDTKQPLAVDLPDGTRVRVRGRIDRVDRIAGAEQRFAVWDYKTGSTYGYDRNAPFAGGRHVQGALYLALATARLRAVVSPEARVELFGYFFPGERAHGERIAWTAEELAEGRQVLARLCEILRRGAFSLTPDADDLTFSDHRAAYGDVQRAAEQLQRKLANAGDNEALRPLARLRGVWFDPDFCLEDDDE